MSLYQHIVMCDICGRDKAWIWTPDDSYPDGHRAICLDCHVKLRGEPHDPDPLRRALEQSERGEGKPWRELKAELKE